MVLLPLCSELSEGLRQSDGYSLLGVHRVSTALRRGDVQVHAARGWSGHLSPGLSPGPGSLRKGPCLHLGSSPRP